MKEIVSVKTGKIQIISDETWRDIVSRGWVKKYKMRTIPEKKLIAPPEIKIKKKNEQNN